MAAETPAVSHSPGLSVGLEAGLSSLSVPVKLSNVCNPILYQSH